LLNDLIIKYNKDIDNIEKQNNNQSHDDIKNIINKKIELKDNIKDKLNSLNKEKKELENQLNDFKYKIYDIEETLIRSELLKKQYETDIFRLKATIEAGQLLLQ
jgi:chromosome segregation ATPase